MRAWGKEDKPRPSATPEVFSGDALARKADRTPGDTRKARLTALSGALGRHIGIKLFVVVGAILALGLGTISMLDLAAARKAVTQQAAEGALSSAQMVWGAVQMPGGGRHDNIRQVFEGVVDRQKLLGVSLYGHDGRLVALAGPSGDYPRMVAPRGASNGLCQSCHGASDLRVRGSARALTSSSGEKVIRAIVPLSNEPRCRKCHVTDEKTLGVVVVDSSLAHALAIQAHAARSSLISGTLSFLLFAGSLGWLLRRLLHRPIALLERGMAEVAAGNFKHRVSLKGDDELARLGRTFDDMTAILGEMTERLQSLATCDYLTSLPNHRYFQDRLREEIERARRYQRPLSLLMADIDHFKFVNDRYGHQVGDQILHQVGAVISSCVRASDVVARYGGEEFALILPETGPTEAVELAERIRAAVEAQLFRVESAAGGANRQINVRTTISIGAAQFASDTAYPEGLIMAADVAMMRAKHMSRNVVCAYYSMNRPGELDDPYLLHRSLEEGTFEAVAALISALETRDPYTRGHSARVARYAIEVAQRLSLTEDETEALRLGGLLHDVGKIGIPDTVLGKPGALTAEERQLIETHPGVGGSIVQMVGRLASLVPIILHHHERYDGHGYPEGLGGEQIPLSSRILSAVDAYDAMRSDRPYRPAYSKEHALAELQRGAGSQFDPQVIKALISCLEAKRAEKAASSVPGELAFVEATKDA